MGAGGPGGRIGGRPVLRRRAVRRFPRGALPAHHLRGVQCDEPLLRAPQCPGCLSRVLPHDGRAVDPVRGGRGGPGCRGGGPAPRGARRRGQGVAGRQCAAPAGLRVVQPRDPRPRPADTDGDGGFRSRGPAAVRLLSPDLPRRGGGEARGPHEQGVRRRVGVRVPGKRRARAQDPAPAGSKELRDPGRRRAPGRGAGPAACRRAAPVAGSRAENRVPDADARGHGSGHPLHRRPAAGRVRNGCHGSGCGGNRAHVPHRRRGRERPRAGTGELDIAAGTGARGKEAGRAGPRDAARRRRGADDPRIKASGRALAGRVTR